MAKDKAANEFAKVLLENGFNPHEFETWEHIDDGEVLEIPDLDLGGFSLSAERVEQSSKIATRIWRSILEVSNAYPLSDDSLQPIEEALAETGPLDSLSIFALYLFARDSTRFNDAVRQATADHIRAKKGALGTHGTKQERAEKERQLVEIWLRGNYTSREVCAFDMFEAVGLTLTAAKKALASKPSPSPWPAKEEKKKSRASRK